VANGGLILLAEDDPRLRRIYVDILDAAGFNVLTAGDGVEALRILSKATPRLLILDIMMPNLNGIETCKRARKIIGDDIPIIFLSALDRIDILRDCVAAGGDDYLIKSDSLSALLKRIRLWMSHGQRQNLTLRRKKLLSDVSAQAGSSETDRADGAPPGLSEEATKEYVGILSLVKEALEHTGPDFGKDPNDKLRLAGYVSGIIEFWAEFNENVESLFQDYLRAILDATDVLERDDAAQMVDTLSELSKKPAFADGKDHGRNDAAQRKLQGEKYALSGLAAAQASKAVAAKSA
jgi:DNA-binding response OmpR family regulator